MSDFQDLLNRFTKGEFNYEQMGNIPEVKKRTNTILNDPRQMLLNTDANYSNMGSYVPRAKLRVKDIDSFRQALDADGQPIPGTSMGIPPAGGAIPGTMVGNVLGVLQGGTPYVSPLQGVLRGGVPVVPQLYGPVLIPRR